MFALETNDKLLPLRGWMLPAQPSNTLVAVPGKWKSKKAGSVTKHLRESFSSIGMALPFQPSVWNGETIENTWITGLNQLERMMKGKYKDETIQGLSIRLNNLYKQLNFDTHRKSIALMIGPDEEKIMYLDFPVRQVVFSGRAVTALQLAATLQPEISFFVLTLVHNRYTVYDYSSGQFKKVVGQARTGNEAAALKSITTAIEWLDQERSRPVFVAGNPDIARRLCQRDAYKGLYHPLLYPASDYDNAGLLAPAVKDIVLHWNTWRTKALRFRLRSFQNSNRLITSREKVLQALNNQKDGLLLIDKNVKRRLEKPVACKDEHNTTSEINRQIELFLNRGNRLEITGAGFLKDFGGMALLQQQAKQEIFFPHCKIHDFF